MNLVWIDCNSLSRLSHEVNEAEQARRASQFSSYQHCQYVLEMIPGQEDEGGGVVMIPTCSRFPPHYTQYIRCDKASSYDYLSHCGFSVSHMETSCVISFWNVYFQDCVMWHTLSDTRGKGVDVAPRSIFTHQWEETSLCWENRMMIL